MFIPLFSLQRVSKYIVGFIVTSLFVIPAFSQNIGIDISSGLYWSNMDWSINRNPQINNSDKFSELRWGRLKMHYLDVRISYKLNNELAIISILSYSNTFDGVVRDIDYSDQGNIIKDQTFKSEVGKAKTSSIGLQYKIFKDVLSKHIDIYTSASYYREYHQYRMMGYDDYYTDLNSFYKNTWQGVDIGLLCKYQNSKCSILYKMNVRLLSYSAKADWNLIPEYKHPTSFIQQSNGIGVQNEVRATYQINKFAGAFIELRHSYNKAYRGLDYVYYQNGDIGETQLNGVNESLKGLGVGISIKL